MLGGLVGLLVATGNFFALAVVATLASDKAEFGTYLFEAAQKPGKVTKVNPTDMARVEKSIREALYFSDYVIVSMHSHEIKGTDKTEPDYF